jgi:hypothetical protein
MYAIFSMILSESTRFLTGVQTDYISSSQKHRIQFRNSEREDMCPDTVGQASRRSSTTSLFVESSKHACNVVVLAKRPLFRGLPLLVVIAVMWVALVFHTLFSLWLQNSTIPPQIPYEYSLS